MRDESAPGLPEAATRVREAAAAAGLAIAPRIMPGSTRTAQEAAAACGCDVAQIVKSLIFRGRETGKPYLLLISGKNRVDEAKAAATVGEALERPDAAFVREATGFAIGGVAPFGSTKPMAAFHDPALTAFATVWAAAGTPLAVFEVAPGDLIRATGSRPLA
ncbi:MAG: YbaK/EbsC family protein [Rhodoblastus sp.]|nr:MAG: YbaK/EbsC family protein [Rhodoblastus sp.]